MNQQIKYRNRYNSPKGITIVALVVTIVIMLILVGVTVTIAINGGLIGTAKDSKEETRYTQVLAEKEMWESEKRSTDRFGIQVETLEEFVNRLKGNKLLTEKEAEQAKQNLKVTIAKKIIYLSKDKVVANSGLWEATIDKKTQQAILTKYKGTGELLKDVVVPNAIEKDGIEYEVIQIGNGNKVAEFEGEITISEGITTVGSSAFCECKDITKVNLPTSLKQIQYQGFRQTTNLKSISLPKGLEVLGGRAFNASGITSIVIPGTVKTVGVLAFFQSYIEKATIEDGVEILDSAAFRSSGLKEITIPGSVKEIKDSCFSEIWGLSKVTINNGVEKIDGGAFYGTAIKEIEIPASVLTIDDSAFSGCGMIQTINVAIDNQNYSSQNDSLYNKDKTKIIRYPSGKKDTEFEVPSTVKEIGNSCFSSCGNLKKIQITSNVEKLATSSFVNQGNLKEINVVSENQYYSSEDGVLFNKDKTEFIEWPQGKSLTEYTVPGTVKTIKASSFYASNIKSIIIPPSVEKVESYAFQSTRATKIVCQEQDGKGVKEIGYRCFYLTDLIEVSLPSTLEKLDGEAFIGSYSLKKITINKPENSLSGKPWNASASVIIEWTGE